MQYLGYGLGSNLIAFGVGTTYDSDKLNAKLDAIYTIRGNTRKDSALAIGKEYYWRIFPTLIKNLPGDSLEHKIIVSSSLNYDVLPYLTIKTTAGFIHATNFRNIKENTFDDLQVSLGATIHLFPLGKDCVSLFKNK